MLVCEVWRLGRVAYAEAWALQNRLVDERAHEGVDRLLLLEHPHTYTLGSSGHEDYVLLPPEELARRGIEVLRVDRGGDVTYHGPGQLVGYPLLQLGRDTLRADFVGYVRKLEQVIIALLADYGVAAKPIKGLTGVWVDTPIGVWRSENRRDWRQNQRTRGDETRLRPQLEHRLELLRRHHPLWHPRQGRDQSRSAARRAR